MLKQTSIFAGVVTGFVAGFIATRIHRNIQYDKEIRMILKKLDDKDEKYIWEQHIKRRDKIREIFPILYFLQKKN
jgi:hypothetical protein